MELDLTGLPEPWNYPSQETVDRALDQTLRALSGHGHRPLDDRLRSYYAVGGDYAGADFLEIEPIEPGTITASDLFATSLLNVKISPHSARRFLNNDRDRQELARLLHDDVLPADVDLTTAGPETFLAMEELYRAVKRRLSLPATRDPNARVTASKLCARKRPALFPIRDKVVRQFLGLDSRWSWQSDWVVFRHIIGHGEVITDSKTPLPGCGGFRKLRSTNTACVGWTLRCGHTQSVAMPRSKTNSGSPQPGDVGMRRPSERTPYRSTYPMTFASFFWMPLCVGADRLAR